MKLTYTQCKQIAVNTGNLREAVEALQNQPEWIAAAEHYRSRDGKERFDPLNVTNVLDLADIQAIQQGGCSSGAFMPAVTYYSAMLTMADYGDDVLQYIQDTMGELPKPDNCESWSGMACFYLSCAVELWCGQFDLFGVDWD